MVTLDVDPMWWKLDVDTMSAPSNALSIQGAICTTAYFGPLDVVKPQPGDTVLASEAAGAAVRQIAKIHAFRTVGIAVTPERARQLTEEFGFDAAFDYNGCSLAELTSADKEACPEGVEIPFDNVGGMKLDAALTRMNLRGRIATRGLISQYDGQTRPAMHNLFQVASSALLSKVSSCVCLQIARMKLSRPLVDGFARVVWSSGRTLLRVSISSAPASPTCSLARTRES